MKFPQASFEENIYNLDSSKEKSDHRYLLRTIHKLQLSPN